MNVSTPAPRDMAAEGRDSLQAQIDLAPAQFNAQKAISPGYTDLQVANLRRAILGNGTDPGLLDTMRLATPQIQALTQDAQSQQRGAEVADLQKYGAATIDALRNADPAQKALLDRVNKDALAGLDAGASLDPATESWLSQKIKSAQAERGVGFGNADAAAEAYAIGDRGLALQQQRRQNATDAIRLNAATGADPGMVILGRPTQAGGSAQSLLNQGGAQVGASGAPQFNAFNSYASDLFNTNYNSKAAANIADANATASMVGAGLSAL